MDDYNEQEKCTDEKCIVCNLVEEYDELIKDNVHWENALRYILGIALDKDDEFMEDVMSENYSDGFKDGLLHGIEQSQKTLEAMYEHLASEIESDEESDDKKYH